MSLSSDPQVVNRVLLNTTMILDLPTIVLSRDMVRQYFCKGQSCTKRVFKESIYS